MRSELGELTRDARVAGPDALYVAAASAQTSETFDEPIKNQIDFDEIAAVNLTIAIANITHNRIHGYGEFCWSLRNVQIERIR